MSRCQHPARRNDTATTEVLLGVLQAGLPRPRVRFGLLAAYYASSGVGGNGRLAAVLVLHTCKRVLGNKNWYLILV